MFSQSGGTVIIITADSCTSQAWLSPGHLLAGSARTLGAEEMD